MVLSYQHQVTLTRLLQDYLVDLCREYLPYTANLEIDGVVCLSNSKDLSSQIVLKVHRTLADGEKDRGSSKQVPPPSKQSGWPWPLKQQGSLYGADAPQDLSLKEPASSKTSLTPLHALASSVEKAPFPGYSSTPNSKPAPLQPINKGAVASLLYQKIMEGGKQWSPQNLSPEIEVKPATPSSKLKEDSEENSVDDDPSQHQGEMLCKICSETVFGGFFALQTHTYEVHRRYVCKKCYSTFSLRCNLRRHERLHEGLKPYSCDSCDKTFSRSTDLRMHMQKHLTGSDAAVNNNNTTKSPAAVACDKCNKTFTSVQNLRWHLYKQHKVNGEQMWVCTICEQLFHDADEYHQHREAHTTALNKRARMDEEPIEHSNDDEAMRDEYQRDLRAIDDEASVSMTSHDESSNEEPRTDAFAAIKQALAMGTPEQNAAGQRNNKRKRKGNPIKHVAEVCDSEEEVYDLSSKAMPVETVNPSSTTSPVPSIKSENDPLQCSYNSDVLASSAFSLLSCSSVDELPKDHLHSLSILSQIRSPLVIKPDRDMSPMSLPRSSEMLYSPSQFDDSLTTPERVKQESLTPVDDGDDDREYTCTYDGCTEPCHGFRSYEVHCVSVHSRYPCKLCKQTFSGKNNRTRHMRNHNRAKIYPCPDCGKYFSRPDSMREHRFIHTASYQEDKCRRCGQEFQRKSLLLAHLKNCFRSSRSKNGSIDESPYMDGDSMKTEHLLPADSNGSDSQLTPSLIAPEDGRASSTPSTPTSAHEGENSNNDAVIPSMTLLNIPRVVNENNNDPSPVATMLKVPFVIPTTVPLNLKAPQPPQPEEDKQDDMDSEESNLVIDTSQVATA